MSLQKKLEVTKTNINIEYTFTNGGIFITADAVTFELIRVRNSELFRYIARI